MRSPRKRAGLAAVIAGLWLLTTPAPARADAGLVAADPADGTALSRPPAAVVLTFSADPDPELSHVSVRDADGTEAGGDEPERPVPGTLRQAVAIPAAGDYTVAYHVVYADGGEATGVLRFSSGTGSPPPVLSPGGSELALQAVAGGHEHGVDTLSGVLLVADAAVLLTVVLLLINRPAARRRRPGTDPEI